MPSGDINRQWAADAVREMREVSPKSHEWTEAVTDGVYAAIILRHAAKAGLVPPTNEDVETYRPE